MKKSILISAAAALTLQIAAQGKYTINGNLQNAEGQKIYLSVGDFGNTEIDSTVVANGKFTFQGEMQGPFESGSLFMGDLNDYRNVKSWGIAIEPMTITVSGDANNKESVVIKGGKAQEELDRMTQEMAVLRNLSEHSMTLTMPSRRKKEEIPSTNCKSHTVSNTKSLPKTISKHTPTLTMLPNISPWTWAA